MPNETSPEVETTEAPAAPKRTRKAKPVANTVFKPHGEEFTLEGDFASIAADLNLPSEDVEFTIEDSAEGKTLSGKPKA